MEKDCVFLLADGQMDQTFKGFLGRENFHLSLGTRSFTHRTLVPDRTKGSDGGIYKRGHEFLSRVRHECRYAIAVLDHQWEGAPEPETIRQNMKGRIVNAGWKEENVEVIVIAPELEVWLCQDSVHVVRALGLDPAKYPSVRQWCEENNFWPSTATKPVLPKEAFEKLKRLSSKPLSGATYAEIARNISVKQCIDPAFCLLRETLQRWFPNDGAMIK